MEEAWGLAAADWMPDALGALGLALLAAPTLTANRVARAAAKADAIALDSRSDASLRKRLAELQERRRTEMGKWTHWQSKFLYGGYAAFVLSYLHRLAF